MRETPIRFLAGQDWLYGILSLPRTLATPPPAGVVIVVGGPQYRAGSHRQFTLLARGLAAAGIPVLRFDQRGMGDSEGEPAGFEHIGEELGAAIDCLQSHVAGLERVVLWGLCDGASAAALYAPLDARVAGLALLNPWVRTEQGAARAAVKHYYGARLRDPGLWKKIASGRFAWRAALSSLAATVTAARRPPPAAEVQASLPDRMYDAMHRFDGQVLLMLSGADLTAREFDDLGAAPGPWRQLLARPVVTRLDLRQADHTLSRRAWQDEAVEATRAWLAQLGSQTGSREEPQRRQRAKSAKAP